VIARLMGLKTVAPKALLEAIGSGGVTVIDVNAHESWLRARVPGARSLDPESFTTGDLPPDRHAALVFYCSNPFCRKAPNAARRAKAMGYDDVRVLSAGISGWLDGGLPIESGPHAGRIPRGVVDADGAIR
jgi:rhodanese-related sulfurtransferase